MLAGNVVALLSPLIFVPVLTYALGPQNYVRLILFPLHSGLSMIK